MPNTRIARQNTARVESGINDFLQWFKVSDQKVTRLKQVVVANGVGSWSPFRTSKTIEIGVDDVWVNGLERGLVDSKLAVLRRNLIRNNHISPFD